MPVTRKPKPRKPSSNGQVMDGTLEIHVEGGQYDGQVILIDLMLLRLCSEAAMAVHPLAEKDGMVTPSAGFVAHLNKALVELGIKSTPAIAVHAWQKMCEYLATTQKKTRGSQS